MHTHAHAHKFIPKHAYVHVHGNLEGCVEVIVIAVACSRRLQRQQGYFCSTV